MVEVVKLQDGGLAVNKGGVEHLDPFHWLEHEDGCNDEQLARPQAADQRKDEAHDAVEHEDFAAEEGCVEASEAEEQEHAPAETQPEVLAAAGGVAVHYVEAESEEEGKDGIGFAANDKPQAVPYHLV